MMLWLLPFWGDRVGGTPEQILTVWKLVLAVGILHQGAAWDRGDVLSPCAPGAVDKSPRDVRGGGGEGVMRGGLGARGV